MTGTFRGGSAGLAHRGSGIFVIPWEHVRPEDSAEDQALDPATLEAGQALRLTTWPGRLDTRGTQLVLEGGRGVAELHARAARIARLLARQDPGSDPLLPDPDDTVLRGSMVLTDGQTSYACAVIDGPPRLLAFHGRHPAPGTLLWVARLDPTRRKPTAAKPTALGLVKGTRVATPNGPRPVESVSMGDLVSTRDAGPVTLAWTGTLQLGGAQLRAMPHLRPLRIPAAALGLDQPDGTLTLAPEHRVVIGGPAARALFNTDEVLVDAARLRDVPGVSVDLSPGPITYHLLAFDAPHVVEAAGLPVESFDPKRLDSQALDADTRASLQAAFPDMDDQTSPFEHPVRRVLTLSEAAILGHRLN